jgi:hypothetical protein
MISLHRSSSLLDGTDVISSFLIKEVIQRLSSRDTCWEVEHHGRNGRLPAPIVGLPGGGYCTKTGAMAIKCLGEAGVGEPV